MASTPAITFNLLNVRSPAEGALMLQLIGDHWAGLGRRRRLMVGLEFEGELRAYSLWVNRAGARCCASAGALVKHNPNGKEEA